MDWTRSLAEYVFGAFHGLHSTLKDHSVLEYPNLSMKSMIVSLGPMEGITPV